MNFHDLHELLREEMVRRIDRGALTGTALARQAGFQQAHVSNFLNRRRALSLEGLDRVLAAQALGVEQLMPLDLQAAEAPASASGGGETVPVVSAAAAAGEPQVRPESVLETVPVADAMLQQSRARALPQLAHWQRFVAIRADGQEAAAMDPVLTPGAVCVLDRHYNSVAAYRAQQRTLLAVRTGTGLALRYVEAADDRLLLRPLAQAFPVQMLTLAPHQAPGELIVGRVCLVMNEM